MGKAVPAKLDDERARLSRRIQELKADLSSLHAAEGQRRPARQAALPTGSAPMTSAQKVQLFMELLRGRTDVYPKRWVNTRKNTSGYSPACSNEWVPGLCDKRKVKCGECPNQAFIPVTAKTMRDHFRGRHGIGIYPMLPDETCWFLAVDCDKGRWQDDVAAFISTCRTKGIPHAVERSRSGNGADVWFFFTAPVAASTARKMGCFLITETMAGRHELPMTSYDRLFPNQDTMPRGGFGNLIALPFPDGPRQRGNSVFVDESWTPFPDQWAFLASVHRMQPSEVEALAQVAAKTGPIIGVHLGESSDDEDRATPWLRSPSRKRPRSIISGPLPARVQALEQKRSPILLTERRDHLEYFAERLRGLTHNLIILQGGMSPKERRASVEQLGTIPETEERLVLATGRFIGGIDSSSHSARPEPPRQGVWHPNEEALSRDRGPECWTPALRRAVIQPQSEEVPSPGTRTFQRRLGMRWLRTRTRLVAAWLAALPGARWPSRGSAGSSR